MVNAFDMPARQAFLTTMISDREDLANAIALNSSMFNAARLVGPSVAGLMIATAGESWCFFVDGVSYMAVIIALVAMKDVRRMAVTKRVPASWSTSSKDGVTCSGSVPSGR